MEGGNGKEKQSSARTAQRLGCGEDCRYPGNYFESFSSFLNAAGRNSKMRWAVTDV